MSSLSEAASKLCTFSSLILVISLINHLHVSCFEFEVGGARGWVKPSAKESETYNQWAQKNRFQIGDTIVFKYSKNDDSVLEVTKHDYDDCNTTNPISRYEDGNTVFKFDRSGFFYFISGEENHCQVGQKMIIRVLVQSNSILSPTSAPVLAPSEHGGIIGGGSGDQSSGGSDAASGPAANGAGATTVLSVASFVMTTLTAVLVFLYLFMN